MQLHFRHPIVGRQHGLVLDFIPYMRFSFRYNPRRWVLRDHTYHVLNPICNKLLMMHMIVSMLYD